MEVEVIEQQLDRFIVENHLPEAFRRTALDFYLPVAEALPSLRPDTGPLLLGINGAQGTGKSTLAEFLAVATGRLFAWQTAVLSIDDFYLTREQREARAETVHPLFAVRGVPGTHDVGMLGAALGKLVDLAAGEVAELPRFDKAADDRESIDTWPKVEGPLDLVILEGWCVGSVPQVDEALREPVNLLERQDDPDATWRIYANQELAKGYASIFSRLHALLFLEAPSFDAIFRWRSEQERKLAGRRSGAALMDQAELERFVQHYERLTRHNLDTLPARADIRLTLGEDHGVEAVTLRQ